MVIVPNSTLANWQKEFTRWCPSLRAFVFHGNKEKRAMLKATSLVAGVCAPLCVLRAAMR